MIEYVKRPRLVNFGLVSPKRTTLRPVAVRSREMAAAGLAHRDEPTKFVMVIYTPARGGARDDV